MNNDPEKKHLISKKRPWLALLLLTASLQPLQAQFFEAGMETAFGPAYTTFRGDLAQMVGFSEIEITEQDVDEAFEKFDLSAPRWLRELFPGLRIEVDEEVNRRLSRSVSSVRFFARMKWVGVSLVISDPRLAERAESKKPKNQWKALRLSLAGDADALAEHLAIVAAADATQVKPFFSKRYDLEAYVHLKKLFLGEEALLEWGGKRNAFLDAELVSGVRFAADPSPVVDLGNVLFIQEKLDDLMEGGILGPVESTTDAIAEALQNIVFGKFRDPRVVPSTGWFVRPELIANLGGSFSVVGGGELSVHKNVSIKGTAPMFSAYGFVGVRWKVWGEK
jgi:hypothetical protein